MRTILVVPLLHLFLLAAACGEPKVDPTIAQAVQTESEMQKAAETLATKERAEREAKAKARRELEARRAEELDAAAQLPAQLPADMARACDAVTSAYDEFMKRGSEKDVLSWHDGRRKALGQRRTHCVTVGNLEVAACEAEALQLEFASLADVPRAEAARMVMQRCLEKFGDA